MSQKIGIPTYLKGKKVVSGKNLLLRTLRQLGSDLFLILRDAKFVTAFFSFK